MKKCGSVLCALLLAAAGCRALDVGLQGGATVSGMMGQDFEDTKESWVAYFAGLGLPVTVDTKWDLGLAAGAFVTVDLLDRLSVQPELWYATIRSGMTITNDLYAGDKADLVWTYRTLEFSVPLKVGFPLRGLGTFGHGRSQLDLYAGPCVLYLLDPPPQLDIDGTEGDWGAEADFKRFAFGAVCGVDFRRYAGQVLMGLDIRLNWHLTSFDDFGSPFADDTRMPGIRASLQVGRHL